MARLLPFTIVASVLLIGAGCAPRVAPPVDAPRVPVNAPPISAPVFVPITIASPEPDALVGNPIIASGLGIAFENTIQLRVRDAEGNVLGEAVTTAYAPEYDAPGPWRAAIAYSTSRTATGFFEAYESSAKDGSELHLVRVPIRFR